MTSRPLPPRLPGLVSLALLLSAGCAPEGVARIDTPDQLVLGETPAIRALGLEPGRSYELVAELTDAFQRRWAAAARFEADAAGTIDPSIQAPIEGDYAGVDPFGLLWSMRMPSPPGDDWAPPEPREYNEITFSVVTGDTALAEATIRQWIVPPDARSERIGGRLVAEMFFPPGAGPAPGVVLLGGSGGGMDWARRTAAVLARSGFTAMAVAYFNAEGLPPDLVEVPVETVEVALDSLESRPEVDPQRIGIIGYSKGAELALLVASRRPDIRAAVAFAPGSAVFQGFRAPDYPVLSSWSVGGEGLPFVPNAYDDTFFETFDGMYLWYRTLARHDAVAAAAIPVERIGGDVLLLSGADDRIWPSTYMAEQIVARLRTNDFRHRVQHLAFAHAGHGIAAPPGEPLTSVAERLGGTAAGNARARAEGWDAVVAFLRETLGS